MRTRINNERSFQEDWSGAHIQEGMAGETECLKPVTEEGAIEWRYVSVEIQEKGNRKGIVNTGLELENWTDF